MFKNSIAARSVLFLYEHIRSLYKFSFIYKIITALTAFFGRVWDSSLLKRILCGDFNSEAVLSNSLSGKLFNNLINWLNNLHKKLIKITSTSVLCRILSLPLTQWGVAVTIFLIPLMPTKIILALCALTCASFTAQLLFTDKYKLSFKMIDFFIIIFAALLLYSLPLSYIPRSSAPMIMIYLLFIFFYFVCRTVIRTKKQLNFIIGVLVLSGAVVAGIAISQYLFGFTLDIESWIDTTMFEENQFRVTGTLVNPNVLGEYLLLVIPISFSTLYFAEKDELKLGAFFAAALMVVAILLTQSRGAMLGLIAAMAFFALLRDRRLIILAIIAVLIIPLVSPSIVQRFLSIGNMKDSSTAYRVSIWMASMLLLADFWTVGIGLSSTVFVLVYQKYAFSASYALHSHNLYLQTAIELGIWGLIIFLIILFLFYRNTFKTKNALSAALCAGMSGFLVQSMTDYTWYSNRLVIFFWVIIALSVACQEVKN